MEVTTSGRFRVLGRPRSDDELLLVDVSDADEAMDAAAEAAERGAPGAISADDYFDPTYLRVDDHEGPQTHLLEMLEPGNLLDATIRWTDGTPRIDTAQLVERTRFHFEEVGTTFAAAREAWSGAVDADEGISARVTTDAEGAPNGVVYVLAEQPGARDVFGEFVDGILPLEPLVQRVDRASGTDGDVPREVFVLRPDEEPFVAVLIALRRNGRLARAVRAQFDIDDPAVDGDDGDGSRTDGPGAAGDPAARDDRVTGDRDDTDPDDAGGGIDLVDDVTGHAEDPPVGDDECDGT